MANEYRVGGGDRVCWVSLKGTLLQARGWGQRRHPGGENIRARVGASQGRSRGSRAGKSILGKGNGMCKGLGANDSVEHEEAMESQAGG